MTITHVESVAQLDGILNKSNDKLSVIDFHATWCGPCHTIAPVYESLSKKYTTVNFLKCDVDAAKEVASRYSVAAMPTFIFLKGGRKVHEVKGANKAALEDGVRKFSSDSSASTNVFSGRGHTLGGAPAPVDLTRDANATLNQAANQVKNLDPQVKILLGLLGAYILFWYLG